MYTSGEMNVHLWEMNVHFWGNECTLLGNECTLLNLVASMFSGFAATESKVLSKVLNHVYNQANKQGCARACVCARVRACMVDIYKKIKRKMLCKALIIGLPRLIHRQPKTVGRCPTTPQGAHPLTRSFVTA